MSGVAREAGARPSQTRAGRRRASAACGGDSMPASAGRTGCGRGRCERARS